MLHVFKTAFTIQCFIIISLYLSCYASQTLATWFGHSQCNVTQLGLSNYQLPQVCWATSAMLDLKFLTLSLL